MQFTFYINRLSFLFVLLVLVLASCSEDNFDITDTEVVTSPPDTISSTIVTGKVTDYEGTPLSNATVELLHGTQVMSIVTDERGGYRMVDLPASGDRVSLRVAADGHVSRLDAVALTAGNVQRDYRLASPSDLDLTPPSTPQALITNLYELSGRLVQSDGSPASGIAVYLISLDLTSWIYTFTDGNGDWSIFSPATSASALFAYSVCEGGGLIDEAVQIIDQDINFGTTTTLFDQIEEVTFSGMVTDCDSGQPVQFGTVTIVVDQGGKTYTGQIVNGVYDVIGYNCSASTCYDITLSTGPDGETIVETCLPLTTTDVVANYTLCTPAVITDNEGELIATIEGVDFFFPVATISAESGDLWLLGGINYETELAFILQTDGVNLGTRATRVCAMVQIPTSNALFLSQDPALVEYTIDSVTTDFVYGSFEGQVLSAADFQAKSITGSFKAVIE